MARKFTFDQVKKIFRAANFELLSSFYNSSKEQLEYRCKSCGYEGETKLENVNAGNRCPRCWEARRGQSSKHNFDYVREKFSARKLLLLEKNYSDSKTPLRYKCNECGYKGQLRFNDLHNGSGSYAEMLCRAAVEKLFGASFQRVRKSEMKSLRGRPLELDIYNDELQIAVEHNGIQHYEPAENWAGKKGFKIQQLHDERRRKFCKENGILLIEIRQLGEKTSLEQLRQQIRETFICNGRKLPAQFDRVKLTNLPRVSATEVYWKEIQRAVTAMGFQLVSQEFFGADKPLLVRCSRGHDSSKTPRSILQGHRCDQCYMERLKNPVRLSDGRIFESGTAASKILNVRKETVNKASLNGWKVKGLGIKRITLDEFRQSLIPA